MSGGSTTTSDTTSNQVNQIPAWMTQAGEQNYAYAQNVAQQPLQQYQGQMVADVAPQTQQAWNVAANSGNVGSDQFNAATAGYLGALGQTPMTVKPETVADTSLTPYMSPFTNDVIRATLPLMQQQNALSQDQTANQAQAAKAFGGSRQGIQQGVAQAQGALNIGQMAAQLNQANFAQAQAAATGDVTRNLQGQEANQTAEQAKINSDILASQGLTNTGQQMNASNVANYNMLSSAGAGESMQAQNQINAQMAKFNQAFNYPQQQLGVLESSLGMTPHDTSTSGQSNTTTTTPTDWASLIEGGAQTAASLYTMSDRTMKTDITKLGKDPKTGVQMHAYRYKGDPKSYPKVVGPMAQDVQKIAPDAVTPMGEDGKLAIKGYAGGTPYISDARSVNASDPNHFPTTFEGYADGTSYALRGSAPYLTTPRAPEGINGAPIPADRVRSYAAGTAYVGQPSLAGFIPPSSPGVAKGIGALSAFRPQVRLPRGAGVPKMQRFADGTSFVEPPNFDDVEAGDQAMGGNTFAGDGMADKIRKLGAGASKMAGGWQGSNQAPGAPQMAAGWGAPSMGYLYSGYANGAPRVPGMSPTDTVPAMLTPGEAVLTGPAAEHIGRSKIAALNAFLPRVGSATSAPRAGARGIHGALANTKSRPKVAGGLA